MSQFAPREPLIEKTESGVRFIRATRWRNLLPICWIAAAGRPIIVIPPTRDVSNWIIYDPVQNLVHELTGDHTEEYVFRMAAEHAK